MAVRIAGVLLPNDKKVEYALTYIFGIGLTKSTNILEQAQVDKEKRVKELAEEEVNKLRELIEKKETVEGDLKREVAGNIKRLKEISSYRGTRHAKGLPTRGQRTKTNNRTVRGNKRGMASSGKRVAAQKT